MIGMLLLAAAAASSLAPLDDRVRRDIVVCRFMLSAKTPTEYVRRQTQVKNDLHLTPTQELELHDKCDIWLLGLAGRYLDDATPQR